ncbi:MAG TPA: histidine kinase [Vicinamibacterales bacterium]|nr:histidine kinase [Vicinamibacterales bacterium]
MQQTGNTLEARAEIAIPTRRSFLTPAMFAICVGGWLAIAAFLWVKDALLVGTSARSLQPTEILLTIQSMVMWGVFSPFIFFAAQRLEFEPGRRLRALVLHAAFATVLCAVDVAMDMMLTIFTHLEDGWSFFRRFNVEFFINIFAYVMVAGIGYALVYQRRLADSRVSALELQRELAQARLDVLARTMQPHFLFNALNTVTALVRLSENKRALTAVVALSDLLRVVLKTGGEARVPLREELHFTERYVSVEQLRFEDRLTVKNVIEPGAEELLVPALILQPLVENAIHHGVEQSGRGCVTIEANATPEWLTMRVRVASDAEGGDPKVAGLGIGLDVTRRRLAYLYGKDRVALDLLVGCGQSTVTLRIPREETVYVRTDHRSHSG